MWNVAQRSISDQFTPNWMRFTPLKINGQRRQRRRATLQKFLVSLVLKHHVERCTAIYIRPVYSQLDAFHPVKDKRAKAAKAARHFTEVLGFFSLEAPCGTLHSDLYPTSLLPIGCVSPR